MRSLRWRIAAWYAASLLAVASIITGVTYFHLRHELRLERHERTLPGNAGWTLHGTYSDAEVADIVNELWHWSLIYTAPIALVALGIGYLLATRSLRPVADLNAQLGRIGARSLTNRVKLAHADREFQAIEANVNALLSRLEESFRQLTEFSAQVAHELRTPLTLLRLQVEENAGGIDPAVAESLQDELRRRSDVVGQCIILATAEQGRLVLHLEPVHLRALLLDLAEAYEPWVRSEGRALQMAVDTDIAVTTDPRYLRQMLHNLLSNAMRHGTGTIRIELGLREEAVFCRVENPVSTVRKETPGTGIGLRVARAVAAALGCEFAAAAQGGNYVASVSWPKPVVSAHASSAVSPR